jgi:hypothetical protein
MMIAAQPKATHKPMMRAVVCESVIESAMLPSTEVSHEPANGSSPRTSKDTLLVQLFRDCRRLRTGTNSSSGLISAVERLIDVSGCLIARNIGRVNIDRRATAIDLRAKFSGVIARIEVA